MTNDDQTYNDAVAQTIAAHDRAIIEEIKQEIAEARRYAVRREYWSRAMGCDPNVNE